MKLRDFICAWTALSSTAVLATHILQDLPATVDSKCNCYLTNTTAKSFFKTHNFFDFRNMVQYVNVPQPIQDPAANGDAPVTSSYFEGPQWQQFWEIQSWNNSDKLNGSQGSDASVFMVNSPNNIYFQLNNDTKASSKTYLTMRTVRHQNFQSAAEFNSVSGDYHYISMRMLARTRGASGAVTAMFTYREGETANTVQEADLEVRTSDPHNSIQYTNQPSSHSSTQNITLPAHLVWSDWEYHRIDWTPGSSTWFVNGQLASHITTQAPRDPSRILFNAWSDGGSWSGNMAVGGEAYLQIQWIDMVFNNTDTPVGAYSPKTRSGGCANVCSIDQTRTIGTPVLISSNGGGGQSCAASKYGQCAGRNWNGCTGCATGSNCKYQNDWYSQCL